MPFLLEHSRNVAIHHLVSGILERSNTVPTVTVNWPLQLLQYSRPGRCDFFVPSTRAMFSMAPQCTHTGPSGQRADSSAWRAAVSSVNIGSVKAGVMGFSMLNAWMNRADARMRRTGKALVSAGKEIR